MVASSLLREEGTAGGAGRLKGKQPLRQDSQAARAAQRNTLGGGGRIPKLHALFGCGCLYCVNS